MARIRHIAMRCVDEEELAAFYQTTFGLAEVLRHRSSTVAGRWAIYLSDGRINIALLPALEGIAGLEHFGFQVDDIRAYSDAALAAGARRGATHVPDDGRKNEAFITDPIDQRVDLSSRGWDYAGATTARVNKLALIGNDAKKLAKFYECVFDLRAVFSNDPMAQVLSDGYLEMSILENPAPGIEGSRTGLKHFGFEVDDAASLRMTAVAAGAKLEPNSDFLLDPGGQRVDIVQRSAPLRT